MNDLENYKAILDAYFGGGTSTFDTTSGTTNEVLGALNDTNFAAFKSAFIERLKRLASLYSDQESSRSHILETLNLLAYNSNWEGAYAELVAFDFLNSDNHWLLTPIKLSNSANASETLANVPNVPDVQDVQNVNLDGYYEDFGVWFDVKLLADKSGDILDGIITEVKKKLKIPGVVISPQYPLDSDYKLFQHKRHELLEELKNKINAAKQPTFIQSKILSDLAYRLMWNGGVQMTVSTYDPYIHAEMHHKLLFTHVKKFLRFSPCLIVFVVFPWFSEMVTHQNPSSDLFYRALCRRFFCQYAKDPNPASTSLLLKNFKGPETLSQVTDKLSGVLFLEDTSIKSQDPNTQNINGFAYLNPNAVHKVSGPFRNYLSSLGFFVDDFEHDNY